METLAANPPTNRYLLWLEWGGTPPLRASLATVEEALEHLAGRLRKARRRLAQASCPSWDHFDEVEETLQGLYAVMALFECQVEISRRITTDRANQLIRHWAGWVSRMTTNLTQGRALEAIELLASQTSCPRRKHQADIFLREFRRPAHIRRRLWDLEKQQDKREERYVIDRQRRGGVQLDGKVEGIHPKYLSSAKHRAKARGKAGYLFMPWTEEAFAVMSFAENEELRKAVWSEHHYAPVTTPAIERMRQARHEQAHLEGQASYAHYRFQEGMLCQNPSLLARHIRQARGTLLPGVRAVMDASRKLAVQDGYSFPPGPLSPWDESVCLGYIHHQEPTDIDRMFPWRETCQKVFGELLSQCGWTLLGTPRFSGKGTWSLVHFHIEHATTGQRNHILYTPFRPKHKGHSYFAGVATAIINRWSKQGPDTREGVFWVSQSVDMDLQAYSLNDLQVLCHEIGHALHFSAMKGNGPNEISYIPEDTIEIPSCLLEMYARDPSVLARWTSRRAPAKAKRARFWQGKTPLSPLEILDHQAGLRSAQMDLLTHLDTQTPFRDLARKVWGEEGRALMEGDESWRRDFIWITQLASIDFTQTIPRSLIRTLITLRDNDRSDAQAVAAAYQSLIAQVMVPGDTIPKAAKAWKQWTGETFLASTRTALHLHARQINRQALTHAQALRRQLARKPSR